MKISRILIMLTVLVFQNVYTLYRCTQISTPLYKCTQICTPLYKCTQRIASGCPTLGISSPKSRDWGILKVSGDLGIFGGFSQNEG